MFAVSVYPPAIGGFTVFEILTYFLIYSCLGWCVEVVYAAVSTGKLINRGFLNGPVCPIYGFGMLGVLFLLMPFEGNTILLYIGGVILPSAVELVGGWALYRLYHTRWWDYSERPFNIGGYVCLEFSLLWGIGTLIMVKIIHPSIAGILWFALDPMAPPLWAWVIEALLYMVYAADVVTTALAASDLARELETMEKVAEGMRAVSDAMTELLGTTAMSADQKMDESRLQLKLAAAEMRDMHGEKYDPRAALAAVRARAEDAVDTARRATQEAKLNASEAANAARLAALGTAEYAADAAKRKAHDTADLAVELLRISDELHSRTREINARPHAFNYNRRRLLRAFPALKHGTKRLTLAALREKLELDKEERENRGA